MKKIIVYIIGVLMIMVLSGCGKQKYRLNYDGNGFESKKTSYAEGEEVTVYYKMIETATDYSFSCDNDVKMKQEFDNNHGYIFTFTMPAHDVTMHVSSRNSMEYDPNANFNPEIPEDLESEINEENLYFSYFEKEITAEEQPPYTEYRLYEREEGTGMILKYETGDGDHEYSSCCLVPENTWDYCMNIVRNFGMADWKDGSGLRGKYYSVVFPDGSGNMMKISSDDMPEDGQTAFDYIEEDLAEAWSQYRPAKTPESDDNSDETGDSDKTGETWYCPECGQKNTGNYCSDCGMTKPET